MYLRYTTNKNNTMSEQAEKPTVITRSALKSEAKKGVEQLVSIIKMLARHHSSEKEINDSAKKVSLRVNENIDQLAEKSKKQSKKSSENLTKPCVVLPSFSSYVEALRDGKKLGKMTKDSPEAKALDSIINDQVSSLLVSTLLISCDNYHQKKEEGITFRVTSLMEEHLEEVIVSVETERQRLHDEDVANGLEPHKLFSRGNYSSAMNNVIASHIRSKDAPLPEGDDLASNLAALQVYLKEHNASLRAKRG